MALDPLKSLKRKIGTVWYAQQRLIDSHEELKRTTLEIERMIHEVYSLGAQIDRRVHNGGNFTVSEQEVVAKIFTGQKLYLDPRDLAVVPHLILDSIWENNITYAWMSVVPEKGVILDIGANFGYYGVIAGVKAQRKVSKVVLFEANTELVPYLQKTLDVNWLNEQTSIANYAISDKKGEVTLNILKGYIGSSSIQSDAQVESYMHGKMQIKTAKRLKVKAITIDDYCTDNDIAKVDLIKMDIEGYEEKAYDGMRSIVKKSPSLTMFVEFTKQAYDTPEAFFRKMLEDFGHLYLVDGEGKLVKQKNPTYKGIVDREEDWIMLVFSKRQDLAK